MQGADSSVPQPALYTPEREVWGIYVAGATPHIWTRAEVEELGRHGVRAVLPIVVPTQDTAIRWWTLGGSETGGYEYTEALVRDAVAWGVPAGSPLVLDIEQATAEAIGASAHSVELGWQHACAAHGLVPWIYSGRTFFDASGTAVCKRWLAEWPEPTPVNPAVPEGFDGWQYAGGAEGDRIDLDVFAGGTYLGCDYQVGAFGSPAPAPAPAPEATAVEPAPTPAAVEPVPEAEKVAEAIGAQADEVATEADSGKASAAAQVLPLLRTHLAELTDLVNRLETQA